MPLYTSTGALNVALSDTTGTGRYSASGALRINLVSGTSYVGLYAADGSMNVVDVTGVSISTYGGLYHPSGAIRGRTAPTTLSGLQAPDGSYYFLGLFSPLNLFSAGEQGAWYDPSDFSTMFQDSAGTTPVTAVEQPVGLILDKSKGLALGSEIISVAADRDFSSNTGYWSFNGGVGISGGTMNWSATADAYAGYTTSNSITTPGKYYEITWTLSAVSSGGIKAGVGNQFGVARTTTGTYTDRVLAGSASNRIGFFCVGTTTASIDNVSVKEVSGNHASQSTAASRPVLSARVNLLTYSEQFDNAAWAKVLLGSALAPSVASTNSGTDPLGTSTADRVQFSLNGNTASGDLSIIRQSVSVAVATYTFSIWLRSFDSNSYVMTISAGTVEQFITVTPTWQLFTVAATIGAAGAVTPGVFLRGARTTANSNTADILMWGADYRVTNDGVGIPAYQRIAAATDYDTSGFPLYLKFDGTDDRLSIASNDDLNFGTGSFWAQAGMVTLGTAEFDVVWGKGSAGSGDNIRLFLASGINLRTFWGNDSQAYTPMTATITRLDRQVYQWGVDAVAAQAFYAINASEDPKSITVSGTGSNTTASSIGSDPTPAYSTDMRLYGLILRKGTLPSASERERVRTWTGAKMGITL